MSDPTVLLSAALLLLIALDLLAAAARAALSSANLARLLAQREALLPQVNRTLAALASLPRLQASLGLAQSLARFLLAGLSLLLLMPAGWASPPLPSIVGVLVVASLLLFLLEWFVERRVSERPEVWAVRLVYPARLLAALFIPLLALPLALSRRFGRAPDTAAGVTESELIHLMDASQEEGVLEQDEREMIVSIFRLGDTLAREIMVPRIDVVALEVRTPLLDAVDTLLKSGFSRLPVYQETIDTILGLLYSRDLLRLLREEKRPESLRELLRPAYFVPETKKVDELLEEMQARRIHMAIVVDEYGGVAGLVTLEDIVEEIVGEIQDEYDQAEEAFYQAVRDGEYVFHGRVDLDDFNAIMESELPKDEANTLAGFIYSRMGGVPTGGENLRVDNLQLTVEQVSGRRIRKVRAQRLQPASENGESRNHADEGTAPKAG